MDRAEGSQWSDDMLTIESNGTIHNYLETTICFVKYCSDRAACVPGGAPRPAIHMIIGYVCIHICTYAYTYTARKSAEVAVHAAGHVPPRRHQASRLYIYIYIYMYRERDVCVYMYIMCIYIYIHE